MAVDDLKDFINTTMQEAILEEVRDIKPTIKSSVQSSVRQILGISKVNGRWSINDGLIKEVVEEEVKSASTDLRPLIKKIVADLLVEVSKDDRSLESSIRLRLDRLADSIKYDITSSVVRSVEKQMKKELDQTIDQLVQASVKDLNIPDIADCSAITSLQEKYLVNAAKQLSESP